MCTKYINALTIAITTTTAKRKKRQMMKEPI